ncbi:MAG: mechanosensitive ion channel protein MscS [Betaproteobacteria bacterium HGW-Betaproteobacteria-22]|nr:MAG: mechanosensitive ion channel protein MscS [Betaproteobacteria bacterium HGW-Betaproteobacteria-22]
MQEVLSYTFFQNTFLNYLFSVGIFFSGVVIVLVFKKYILSRLKTWSESTQTSYDDLATSIIETHLIPFLYLGFLYIALYNLALSPKLERGLDIAAIILATVLVIRALTAAVGYFLHSYVTHGNDSEQRKKQLKGISRLVNFVIWALAFVFLLDNLGVKISAAVAGLGIGGIAVALAAQAVLGDLFSYFVILFDKPFEIGDFIVIGNEMGVVEYVGIKTTRIRALSGEQLVFSNTDLTNSRVHNFKKMERRRVVFKLRLVYQTPYEKLLAIPETVKGIIETQQDTTFDRGHFATYGDSSLDFEFVYYVDGADYNKYMDIQQAINLAIFKAFEKENVQFAYPSQTLFLNKS